MIDDSGARWESLYETLVAVPDEDRERFARVLYELVEASEVLGPDDERFALSYGWLLHHYWDDANDPIRCEAACRRWIVLRGDRFVSSERDIQVVTRLAGSLGEQDRDEEEVQQFREAVRLAEETFGPTAAEVAPPLLTLASVLRRHGHTDADVLPLHERRLALLEGSDRITELNRALTRITHLYRSLGHHEQAERAVRRHIELRRQYADRSGEGHLHYQLSKLADLVRDQGRIDEAIELYREALADHATYAAERAELAAAPDTPEDERPPPGPALSPRHELLLKSAAVLRQAGRLIEALEACREATKLVAAWDAAWVRDDDDPSDPLWHASMRNDATADVHDERAAIARAAGGIAEADQLEAQARDVRTQAERAEAEARLMDEQREAKGEFDGCEHLRREIRERRQWLDPD